MKKLVFVFSVVVLFLGCISEDIGDMGDTSSTTSPSIKARRGDIVYVNYIGKLTDGSVFDSSYMDVAKEAGIYDFLREYGPFEFRMGEGQVIAGFENAVYGMSVGENKTVRIPPESAYGEWVQEKVSVADRVQSFPRVVNLSLDQFWVEFGEEPRMNLTQQVELYEWNKTVVALTNSTVMVRFDPWPNASAHTNFGLANVSVDEMNVYISANPVNGSVVETDKGPARIIEVTQDSISLDFNHPLAGKTLVFYIKLENVTKGH